MKALVADFESTVYNGKDDKTHVWLAGYKDYDVPDEYVLTESIEDFVESTKQHPYANIFMHELKRIHYSFLLAYWRREGFQINMDSTEPRHNAKLVSVSHDGSYITVYYDWDNKIVHNYIDTMKFTVGSIEEFGKRLEKEIGKVPEIPEGSKHQVSKFDKRYIKRKLTILAGAMGEFNTVTNYENGISSYSQLAIQFMLYDGKLNIDRVEGFKPHNYYAGHGFEEHPYKIQSPRLTKRKTQDNKVVSRPKGLPKLDGRRKPTQEMVDEALEYAKMVNDMPEVSEKDVQRAYDYYGYLNRRHRGLIANKNARKAFRGPWFYQNPDFKGGEVKALGATVDNNGLHSYMYMTQKLPRDLIGTVTKREDALSFLDGKETLYIATFWRLEATVKPNSFPILQPREDDDRNQRLNKYQRYPETIILENSALAQPDYEYLLKHYEIKEVKGLMFEVYSVDFELMKKLRAHGLYWTAQKNEARRRGDLFMYDQSKLMLNGPIGYFGVNKENETRSDVAKATFIYSYGRCYTAETANGIGRDFMCYASADSLHFIQPPKALKRGKYDVDTLIKYMHSIGAQIDPVKPGAWKIERIWQSARYIKISTYGEETLDGKWHSKHAGFSMDIPKEEFVAGNTLTQLLKTEVDGGVVLKEVTYRL